MADIPRIAVRSPQPFDIVGDSFTLCGLGVANEGVLGSATLTGGDGAVLAQLAPMSVPGSGFLFTLFDFTVTYGVPSRAEGILSVEADNPSGLPQNSFSVTVPVTFGRPLLGASYAGFRPHKVVGGDTLFGIAQAAYGDGHLWHRILIANRDQVNDPNVIRVGQVLRIPFAGA
jgi:hypothetical protein